MYIIPRFIQVVSEYLYKKKIVTRDLSFLLNLIFGFSIGVASMSYNNGGKDHIKEKYKNVCRLLAGDDAVVKKSEQKLDKMGDGIASTD